MSGRELLSELLDENVDEAFSASGFARRVNGVVFARKVEYGRQTCRFIASMPRYSDDNSIVHFSAGLLFEIPLVEADLEALLGGDIDRFPGSQPMTIGMNVGLVGPTGSYVDWRPTSKSEIPAVSRAVVSYFNDFVFPFTDKYGSLGDLATGFSDPAFLKGDGVTLQFVAMAAHLDDTDLRRDIVDARVVNPNFFERYPRVRAP